MIYTMTFNPSLDYIIQMDTLEIGSLNRGRREQAFYGGKGLNIAKICQEFDVPCLALGFVAGYIGEAIEKGAQNELGIKTDFIHLKSGLSRINVKLKSDQETFINASGPQISERDIDRLMERLKNLDENDVLVLAGSVPANVPRDIYARIMSSIDPGVQVVIDAEGELLEKAVAQRPMLVKVKRHALEELSGGPLDHAGLVAAAKQLQAQGAGIVLVSLAGEGSLCVDEQGEVYTMKACQGRIINTVGASASMTAGFLISYLKHGDIKRAMKLGSACCGATAFSDYLGTRSHANYLLKQLKEA